MNICNSCKSELENDKGYASSGNCRRCYNREWYQVPEHRDARLAYWHRTKDVRLENRKAYYAKTSDHHSTKRRERAARYKDQVYKLLGYICSHCGFSDVRALQVDHIKGGGNEARKKAGTNESCTMYMGILKHPSPTDEFQILCANCNWIKRHENKEIGGKRKCELIYS